MSIRNFEPWIRSPPGQIPYFGNNAPSLNGGDANQRDADLDLIKGNHGRIKGTG